MAQSLAKNLIHLVYSTKSRIPCLGPDIRPPLFAYMAGILKHWESPEKWLKTQKASLRAFHWQDGYGAFSVSQSQVNRVRRYVEDQAKHHRQLSFQDEFRALLKRYEIEYDERYVWD